MNSYDRIYTLLTESLSQAAKQTLANNRLSKKAFSRKNFDLALQKVMKREDARSRIKTSPKRDVVRAAGLSQTLYAPKHSLAYLPKPSRKREDSGRSYQRMFDLLIEARMTNKQTQDVGGELIGEPGKPSKIISGGGYNYKRAKHGVRRSEKLGPDKVSNKDMDDRTSATGVAGSVPSLQGLKDRSRKQGRGQDIEGMAKQMKKDPDAFAPPTRLSPDSRNEKHQKYTQVDGRTRQATHRRVKGKPMDMLTLPSERHAGSAKRAKERWVGTDKKARIEKALAKRGKFLRGQDHRLG